MQAIKLIDFILTFLNIIKIAASLARNYFAEQLLTE